MYQLALGGYLANKVTRALRPIETERTRFLDGLEPPLASSQRTRRARRLPQPAAGPANGGGSEVLSVVPPVALPKPFVPSGCASIGIIAAPLFESLLC